MPRVNKVRYEPERPYVGNALKSGPMGVMLKEKMALGEALYAKRVVKGRRPHRGPKNFSSVAARIALGGEKRGKDRLVGELFTTARHGIVREFGRSNDIVRGAYYKKSVAERYNRGIRGRAKYRKNAEHVLGGDNRRKQSIVATLENM